MSLDTYKLHKLLGKDFDKLYTAQSAKWKLMVEKSVESVRASIDADAAINAGDVVAAVVHGIKISKEFEDHLESQKLTQQYWVGWFAEYVVEQIYPHAKITEHPAAGGEHSNV